MTERLDRLGVDLVLKLGERNTLRSCVGNGCDHDTDYYVLTDEVLLEYACEEHLEGSIERAQAKDPFVVDSHEVRLLLSN